MVHEDHIDAWCILHAQRDIPAWFQNKEEGGAHIRSSDRFDLAACFALIRIMQERLKGPRGSGLIRIPLQDNGLTHVDLTMAFKTLAFDTMAALAAPQSHAEHFSDDIASGDTKAVLVLLSIIACDICSPAPFLPPCAAQKNGLTKSGRG